MMRTLAAMIGARLSRVPIRMKLTLTFASVMVVLFGLLFLLLYVRFATGLDNGIQSSLEARTADLSALAHQNDARVRASPVLPESSGEFAQILGPQGQVLAFTPGLDGRPLLGPAWLARARHGRITFDPRENVRLLAHPVPGSRHVIVVGASLIDRDRALAALQTLMFIGGPIGLLIACVAGYVVAANALDPVERMRKRAARMCGFESDERLPVPPARDEIQRLGETLNEMLARVEEVVGRGRAFVAGASHELRTPLTILRLELDDALAGDRSHEDLEAAIRSAGEEVSRLTSLAEDLLVIAQADQERLPIRKERCEAQAVMRVVAERYAHLNDLIGRTLTIDPTRALVIEADVVRLDQAISNLVSNALRFGEGSVVLRAAEVGGNIELHVFDQGPGFPPDFLPRAFERFSRGDPTRARGGAGLGLAIVKAIAESHGGRLDAKNRPGGGADVWLTLPGVEAAAGAPEAGALAAPAVDERSA
jgi:two-component system OmpR family sensor kinase